MEDGVKIGFFNQYVTLFRKMVKDTAIVTMEDE